MISGESLSDDNSTLWLERLVNRVLEAVNGLGYEEAVVSCSTLRKQYRDIPHSVVQQGVRGLVVDLQARTEELTRRMQSRDPHYMKPEMLDTSSLPTVHYLQEKMISCRPM